MTSQEQNPNLKYVAQQQLSRADPRESDQLFSSLLFSLEIYLAIWEERIDAHAGAQGQKFYI